LRYAVGSMPDESLYNLVHDAARRRDVCDAVADLYRRLAVVIDERKPRCDASGRCCRFEEFGHRLYVTTIELAAFVASDDIAIEATTKSSLPIYQPPGGCPFQFNKLCSVHTRRPFGCRMFYCDPTAQDWQQEQYEQFHAEIKLLHERFGIPYRYMEWRGALRELGITIG